MLLLFIGMPEGIQTACRIAQIQDQCRDILLFPFYIAQPHPAMQNLTIFGSTPSGQNSKKNRVCLIWWTTPFFWADLVYGLYQVVVSNGRRSIIKKWATLRDAPVRLYGLIRPWVQNVSIYKVMARICYLDPLLVLRVAKGWLSRVVNMRPNSSCWLF